MTKIRILTIGVQDLSVIGVQSWLAFKIYIEIGNKKTVSHTVREKLFIILFFLRDEGNLNSLCIKPTKVDRFS